MTGRWCVPVCCVWGRFFLFFRVFQSCYDSKKGNYYNTANNIIPRACQIFFKINACPLVVVRDTNLDWNIIRTMRR